MNKKQRKKKEKEARHQAQNGAHNPIPNSPIEHRNEGEDGEQQRKVAETLKQVTRWLRFKQWYRTKWTEMRLAEIISISLTLVIAGSTVTYAIVAIQQWRAMRDSNRINLRSVGRAWIQPSSGAFPFNDADPDHVRVTVPLSYRNIGKTPALKMRAQMVLENLRNGESPTFDYNKPRSTYSVGIVFPDEAKPSQVKLLEYDPGNAPYGVRERTLSRAEYQALVNGDSWLALYGTVDYEDVFHIHHWVHYCNWFPLVAGQVAAAGSCTEYNSVDDN